MNLQKKLQALQDANLMTAEQAAAIMAYEEATSPTRSWAAWGIACVGVAAILLGILAIIGVNWHLLSANLKLTAAFGGFAILLGLVKLSFNSKQANLFLDVLMVTWQGYTLACIALIGQIYNLQGPLWQTLLFWVILISPTILVSSRFIVNIIWLGLATGTLFLALADNLADTTILNGAWLALPFLYLIASDATDNTSFFGRFTHPLRILGWIGFLVCWVMNQELTLLGSAWNSVSASLLLGTMGLLLGISILQRSIPSSQKSVLLLALVLYTGMLILMRHTHLPEMLEHILSLTLVMLMAVYAAQQHRKRVFNLLTLLAVGRLAMLYVLLAGSLLTTGIGLIITGILILCLLYGWYKHHSKLLEKLGN